MFRLLIGLLMGAIIMGISFPSVYAQTGDENEPLAEVTSCNIPLGDQIPYQKGISVVLFGNDSTMAGNTTRFFDDLQRRNLGVNSIIFVFPIYQDGAASTVLYEDLELTPSLENLAIYIREAHNRGYSIWLKPLIDDERTGTWRGAITPGWDFDTIAMDAWFASYGALLMRYAMITEQECALGLIIGTEMESMDKPDPKYTDRWNALIANLRSVYSGNLTYAKNWTPVDVREMPGFIPSLDLLMIDAFFDLRGLGYDATSEEIYHAWQAWLPNLQSYYTNLDIPIMFAEVGVTPRVGSYSTPWNGDNGGRLDYNAQVVYYEGTCNFLREFGSTFGFTGAYWWAVGFYDNFENQRVRAEERNILTYNFYDLPAEETLRECYRG